MCKPFAKTVILIVLIALVAGCGPAAPTATPVPPTPTAPPAPQPPTAAPALPTAAPTTAPTTAAPTATLVPAEADDQVIDAATAAGLEQVAVLALPDSFVNAIAFSPDGQTMFTGDRNGEVLAWERDTWEKTTYLPAQSTTADDDKAGVYFGGTLVLSPDGNVIVTDYGEEGTIAGRDRDGQVLFTIEYGAPVYSMAISPDGNLLAVGGLKGNVIIFDLEMRQAVADLAGDYEYISNLVFSRDSRTLLVCYERPSNVMKTWDTTTWQEAATFTHVTERVDYHDVLFSPDDQELVIATTENVEIKFLDLATKQVVREISEHTRAPYQLAFSPDGSLLASASDDGTLRLWNLETGDRVKMIQTNREAGAVAFSPDGTLIAISVWGEGVQVWGLSRQPSGTPSGGTSGWARTFEGSDYGAFFDIALTEDGNVLAVGATNHLHVPPYSGDALLMKLTLEGDLLWERTWGGDGYEQAWSVTPADDGGYYLFGETDSYGVGDRDFFLLKTAADGSEDWFKTYGRAHREWPYGMLRLSDGDLLIYGLTTPEAGSGRNQYALRLGSDGEVIWEYTVESPGEELVIDALETTGGDLVLAVIFEEDGGLVKLDADGNVLWTKRYELAGWQYASQVAETDDGGFLLVGFSMSSGSRRQVDTWIARCTSTGDLDWETSFGEPAFDDYATSLIRLEDGTYLIGSIGNGMLLSRVDQDGNVLWRQSLIGQTVYGSQGLIELEDGGFLVAGFIQIVNGRSYDAIILRTDAEGRIEK